MASKLEIELDDGATRVLKIISQAHKQKQTIRSVRIEYWGEEGGIRLSLEQYNKIFGQIGNLPNLSEVYLHFTHSAPPLPVQSLQKLIYCHAQDEEGEDQFDGYTSNTIAAKHLEYLSLHHVKLAGSEDEFESFRAALQSNRSLSKAHFQGCSSLSSLVADQSDIDADGPTINHGMSVCLQALAHLPSLEKLHLDGVCRITSNALTALFQSSNLKLLELWNMADDLNRYAPDVFNALGSLEELEISSNLQATAGNAIANMLETNSPNLETLGFDVDYSDYAQSLARVLQLGHNENLKTLHLRIVGGAPIAEEPEETEELLNKYIAKILAEAHTLIQALEHNNALEHLHINFYTIPPNNVEQDLVKFFEELLEVNSVLKNISLRGNHRFANLGPKVEFRLRLNRAGLHHLLLGEDDREETAPRSKWVETILANQTDLDIVFYLLSTNPSLCCGSGGDQTPCQRPSQWWR